MSPRTDFAVARVLGLGCLSLAWLVPNHYPPWGSFYTETVAALGLGFLFLSAVPGIGSRGTLWSTWLFVALATVPWAQWAAGRLAYSGDAWLASLYLIAFALAIGVAFVVSSSDATFVDALSWACLAGSAVSSAMALAQAFQITGLGIWMLEGFPGMRPYGNLGQPNNLATLIGFGFAGLFVLRRHRRIGDVSTAAMAVLMVLGAAVTQSRTALLYGPIALAALWWWSRRGVVDARSLRPAAAITVGHWLLTYFWPALQTALLMFASTSLEQREARTIRFLVWPVLVDAMSTRPWLGFGWLQVGEAELSAVDRHPPATELYLQAHNLLLDLAIFCGYPLAIGLTLLFAWWCITRMARVKDTAAAAGMLVIAMFATHAMLELPHHYAYFLIPVGLWIGVVEQRVDAVSGLSARWLWPLAGLGLVGILTIWRDYPRLEEEFRLIRFEGARIQTPIATEPVPSNPALSSLTAFLEQARRTPSKGMTDDELLRMRQSVERYPYAASLKRYAIALWLNGRHQEAVQTFNRIGQLYGPKIDQLHRRELRDDIAEGKTDLRPLESALP